MASGDLTSNYMSCGFVGLSPEIIYRIISATQGAIISCMNEATMEKKYSERRDSLLALSNVCRSLRVTLLPLLWERLEACCLPGNQENQSNRDRWTMLMKNLAGQLEVITVTRPLYASYIKIINIAIEPQVAYEMLFNLAPALALMPNLHTIQIVIDPNLPKVSRNCNIFEVDSGEFREAFENQCYPSVKRVVLPEQARTILECFPEVCDVCLNQPYQNDFFQFLNHVARKCHKLERFGWIDSQFSEGEGSRAAATKKLPKLRGLEYHIKELNDNEISQLVGLKNLEDLSLVIDDYDGLSQCDEAVVGVIGAAKRVLAESSSVNRRLDVKFRVETRSFIFDRD